MGGLKSIRTRPRRGRDAPGAAPWPRRPGPSSRLRMPEPVGEVLACWQRSLAALVAGCRWTATRPFHATLAFLGDVPNRDLNELCAAVAAVARPIRSLRARGRRPGRISEPEPPARDLGRPDRADLAPLLDLQRGVVKAVAAAGHPADDSRFHPHVTLGRFRPERGGRPADLTAILAGRQQDSAGTLRVSEVLTFASTLGRAGPDYATLGACPARRRKSPERVLDLTQDYWYDTVL